VPAIMGSLLRDGILAVFFAMALFSTSCEKHPIGQMPEVQTEQPDPADVGANAAEHSGVYPKSETPAQAPNEAR
jgi:hypothetical protein